jgi:hypothetical protein
VKPTSVALVVGPVGGLSLLQPHISRHADARSSRVVTRIIEQAPAGMERRVAISVQPWGQQYGDGGHHSARPCQHDDRHWPRLNDHARAIGCAVRVLTG